VVPGLIRRFHEAKVNNQETVVVWGTGKPRREFLYVDDMAEACIFIHELDKDNLRSNTKKYNHILI
jgi:GDP-L-fucose synthase